MGKLKKGLNVTWKVMLSVVCLIAIIIGVCELNVYHKKSKRKFYVKQLSNDVVVREDYDGEYFVYNDKMRFIYNSITFLKATTNARGTC